MDCTLLACEIGGHAVSLDDVEDLPCFTSTSEEFDKLLRKYELGELHDGVPDSILLALVDAMAYVSRLSE